MKPPPCEMPLWRAHPWHEGRPAAESLRKKRLGERHSGWRTEVCVAVLSTVR